MNDDSSPMNSRRTSDTAHGRRSVRTVWLRGVAVISAAGPPPGVPAGVPAGAAAGVAAGAAAGNAAGAVIRFVGAR